LREEHLRNAFSMFDIDGSGKIDAKEIIQLLTGGETSDALDREQVLQIIEEVDVDGDGEIDFEEFILMMRSIKPPALA
jgi:calcium-dependent protein kinase